MVGGEGTSARSHAQYGRNPGETFFLVFMTGVVCVLFLLFMSKMVDRCEVLRLHDVDELLTKKFLNAWKSGKVCCAHDDCVSKMLLFCHDGLNHHFRIQHSRVPCGEEQRRQGNDLLRKRPAAETLHNLSILSKKRLGKEA